MQKVSRTVSDAIKLGSDRLPLGGVQFSINFTKKFLRPIALTNFDDRILVKELSDFTIQEKWEKLKTEARNLFFSSTSRILIFTLLYLAKEKFLCPIALTNSDNRQLFEELVDLNIQKKYN